MDVPSAGKSGIIVVTPTDKATMPSHALLNPTASPVMLSISVLTPAAAFATPVPKLSAPLPISEKQLPTADAADETPEVISPTPSAKSDVSISTFVTIAVLPPDILSALLEKFVTEVFAVCTDF